MKRLFVRFLFFVALAGCRSSEPVKELSDKTSDFTIAFGSCNKTTLQNRLWDDVLAADPDVWIWGGDIVYADTDNMDALKREYDAQNNVFGYAELKKGIPVIGTWDDHDYGLNDGGTEFYMKKGSQQEFLDFMDVPKDDPRRTQEGVYTSHDYTVPNGRVRVIVLDTRYFRTALTKNPDNKKRNIVNKYGEGTVLGHKQWKWLERQLTASNADFNIIVSSIQVLSREHGFEKWGNFPHEIDKLKRLISASKAKGVVLLSGDRHISEFSREAIADVPYPLVDFTSSGLTHAYHSFKGEPNRYRVGEVVYTESFGLLHLDFKMKRIKMKIIGAQGDILGELQQRY